MYLVEFGEHCYVVSEYSYQGVWFVMRGVRHAYRQSGKVGLTDSKETYELAFDNIPEITITKLES